MAEVVSAKLAQGSLTSVIEINDFESKMMPYGTAQNITRRNFMSFNGAQFGCVIFPEPPEHFLFAVTLKADSAVPGLRCLIKIAIVNKDGCGSELLTQWLRGLREPRDMRWLWSSPSHGDGCPLSIQQIRDLGLLSDGTLRVKIFANFCDDAAPVSIAHKSNEELISDSQMISKSGTSEFVSDMERLLDGKDGDILIDVDGGTLSAHKVILNARSPVFAKMLDSSMLEAATSRVTITDLSKKTFANLLHFIYTAAIQDNVVDDTEGLVLLASAGDKYGMQTLVEACGERIRCLLSPTCVVSVLLHAHKMGLDNIKSLCLR
jgi:hypothetical protein